MLDPICRSNDRSGRQGFQHSGFSAYEIRRSETAPPATTLARYAASGAAENALPGSAREGQPIVVPLVESGAQIPPPTPVSAFLPTHF